MAALSTDDVSIHADKSISVFCRSGKGKKKRRVCLKKSFGKKLLAWARSKGSGRSLFDGVTAATVGNRFKAVAIKAGLPHLSTHFLRHGYCTHALNGDGKTKPSLISVSRSL